MNEAEMRQLYVDLQPGDSVEIVHHVQEDLAHAPWPRTSVDPDAPETLERS